MFIEQLIAELKAIEIPPSPDEPVGERETVVGTLDEGLQRLYGLALMTGKALETQKRAVLHLRADLAFRKSTDAETQGLEAAVREGRRLENRLDLVSQIFWRSIKDKYPELIDENAGLRENWQVCLRKDEDDAFPLGLLAALCRGGLM